jgi:hypothetical protein
MREGKIQNFQKKTGASKRKCLEKIQEKFIGNKSI